MRLRLWTLGLLLAALCDGAASAAENASREASPQFFEQTLQPLVKKYCLDCHGGGDAEGQVRLDRHATRADLVKDGKTWRRVLRVLRAGKMPPKDSPRPAEADVQAAIAWLDATLNALPPGGVPDPGRVTLRRLNREEYTNTIRDLLGVEFNAAEDFPADDVGYGFDNIGDVLTLPPLLMEKYLSAAEQIAAKARFSPPTQAPLEGEAARQFLNRLATRAYRRPVTDGELARLVQLAETARKQGDRPEQALRLALRVVLVSPHFLFRIELDPQPNDEKTIRELNEYELASRLSYFLWSSMPDDELFEHAARGTLRRNLDAQARRMLADGKSQALARNFGGQWLQLRNLERAAPNRKQFPGFDDELRQAMRLEAELFFAAILREDRSVLEFVDADFTYLNERLARHYGIPNVEGKDFRRVALRGPAAGPAAAARGGVITQAGMLTVTSNPTRTSPVKRGKWILDNILGTPPSDPPPDVPMLQEDAKAAAGASLRQRMEQHRKDPNCAVCHEEMDALGFALENFDAVGAWRTKDGNFPIDAAGELPGARKFNGPRELKGILLDGKDNFTRCLAEKMLTYALGRGVEPFDKPAVDRITAGLAAGQYKFSALILAVAHSDPFQKRRGPSKEQEP